VVGVWAHPRSDDRSRQSLELVFAGPAGALDDESLDVEAGAELPLDFADEPPEGLWYKSEYQPPPFKMKLPPLMRRRAFDFLQVGHFLAGASEMRCSSSH
jgi:hypothetical protein